MLIKSNCGRGSISWISHDNILHYSLTDMRLCYCWDYHSTISANFNIKDIPLSRYKIVIWNWTNKIHSDSHSYYFFVLDETDMPR